MNQRVNFSIEIDGERADAASFAQQLFELFWNSPRTMLIGEFSINDEPVYEELRKLYSQSANKEQA